MSARILKGTLIKPYLGYGVGAEIYYSNTGFNFAILIDRGDENYGISMDSNRIPVMENIELIEQTEVQESKFFTIFGLIQQKVLIPKNVDFNFTFEK